MIGFGNFGQFLAKTFVCRGHIVIAYSRTDYLGIAKELAVSFFSDADDLCEAHADVILLCTSILSTKKFVMSLPIQRLKRSTLFVDVLSVKEFPRSLFFQSHPSDFDILCTHPMFGPDSGKNGWNDLAFVYDKVRIGNDEERISRCDGFLDKFMEEGCRMVEMFVKSMIGMLMGPNSSLTLSGGFWRSWDWILLPSTREDTRLCWSWWTTRPMIVSIFTMACLCIM